MNIRIPAFSFVVLIGPSGSGKSTFARRHFQPTEILSSDTFRGLVGDDENDQSVTRDAFDALHFVAAKRLAAGRLTVVDATNVQPEARKPLVSLAREYHCLPVAIVLNIPEDVCRERNRERLDRQFGSRVIRQQRSQLRRSLRGLKREGFRQVIVMASPGQVEAARVERAPLWNDKRDDHGPFDIIGDVHGCCDELDQLLRALGYEPFALSEQDPVWGDLCYRHSEARRAVFLGDLVDRGPRNLDTLRLVRNMVETGQALCVPGNHDMKFLRKLRGHNVQMTHGMADTVRELESLPEAIREPTVEEVARFLDRLVSHYVLDEGRLVVAHAGMKEDLQGRASGRVREFALYGETTGETDEFGLPVRFNWAAEYRGKASVVYGHTPVPEPDWLNRTLNIDTGCVFGGRLTALRYPEQELVSVAAAKTYSEPSRPFLIEPPSGDTLTIQQAHDQLLDASDVLGKRIISTRLRPNITVREENAAAALEVMSRFAANPKWLIYLPPTISPPQASVEPGFLEHPADAFAYFNSQGVTRVVCEEKHMGSRAVVIVTKDDEEPRRRFGVVENDTGVIYTRTGRRFFGDRDLEHAMLERLRAAMHACGFWQRFQTNWACLDCELMPWSAKAEQLLRTQYAAVGSAGRASLPQAVAALEASALRLSGIEKQSVDELAGRYRGRQHSVDRYVAAYRQYCWNVGTVDDLKLAPFHLLATEGEVHVGRSHEWHLQHLAEICSRDADLLAATPYRIVDVGDPASLSAGTEWWRELAERGGEGIVVKPFDFVVRGKRGLVQPAVKCRGREYLRIIYGPDYTADEHLDRLRKRSVAHKRSLALREFTLGIEALERFVRREPLRRVHECVFGVLALESEPVDPRL